jgi:retrovirus-related pol polyprotein from transposon 17.6
MQNKGQTPSLDDGKIKSKEIWYPISYFSQGLKKHQINYTITEKETLAVIVAIRKFKQYLEGKFTIETDHHALCQLHNCKSNKKGQQ